MQTINSAKIVITLAAIFTLSGCNERSRATGAALEFVKERNPNLLTIIPKNEGDCYWGCFTQICAAIEVEKVQRGRDVVFVFVSGLDDTDMDARGPYTSMSECLKQYDHG